MPRVLVEVEFSEKGAAVIGQTAGSLRDLDKQAHKTSGALSSIFQGVGQAVGQRAFAALEALPRFLFDSMKAAGEAERGIGALNLALANQGHFTAETSRALQDHAAALSMVTTSSTGAIVGAEAMLATYGMTEEQIKRATTVALDYAAATGKDLNSAIETLGKAYVGNTAGLSKMGIKVDENLTKTQKYDAAVAALARRFGGAAVQDAQIFEGGLKQLGNATDDVKEEFGKLLGQLLGSDKPFGAAIDAARRFANYLRTDVSVALSEFRAQYAEMNADLIASERGQKIASAHPQSFYGMYARLTGIAGSDKQDRDLVVKALRDQAKAIREVSEAEQAGIRTKGAYTNNTRDQTNAIEALNAAFDRKKYTLQIQDEFNRILKEAGRLPEILKSLDTGFAAPLKGIGEIKINAEGVNVALLKVGPTARVAFDDVGDAAAAAAKEIKKLEEEADVFDSIASAAFDLADMLGGTLGTAIGGVGQVFAALADHERQAAANLDAYGKQAMTTAQKVQAYASAVMALVAAYQHGKASGDKFNATLSGAASGAAAGAPGGWVGMLIGGVLGGAAGYLGAAAGEKERLQALRAELELLREQARIAGITLMETFAPDTAEGMLAAINEINRALGLQVEAHRALDDAMERWGITIDQLGPRFREQKLHEMAAELLLDFRILMGAGVDISVILDRMGDALVEFFLTAIRTGTSVPEAMRPILQALIDDKRLIDENGHAFETVEETGITFATNVTDAIQRLIDKITELVNALLGIPNITRTVTIVTQNQGGTDVGDPDHPGWFGPGYNYDNTIDQDNNPNTGSGYASGGYIPATAGGRLIRVAEGGEGEWVVNRRQMQALRGDGEGGSPAGQTATSGGDTVIVYIGGEKLDGVIARRTRAGLIPAS